MNKSLIITATVLLVSPSLSEDATDDGWIDSFPIDNYTMLSKGQNRYWSLNPGQYVVLGELKPSGSEFVIISVLDQTEAINGIETRVIEEREYKNGELIEVSRNFFAMARKTRDIYYFGEDVDDYQDGQVTGHSGQWRAGTDRAIYRKLHKRFSMNDQKNTITEAATCEAI